MFNTKEIQKVKQNLEKQRQADHDALLNEICKELNNNVSFHCMTRFSFYIEPKRPEVKRIIYDIAHKHGYNAGEVVSGRYQNCIKIFTKEC